MLTLDDLDAFSSGLFKITANAESYCDRFPDYYFKCKDGNGCTRKDNVCDWSYDCDDGSDEAECPGKKLFSHLHKNVEGLYFHYSLSVYVCVGSCLSVCLSLPVSQFTIYLSVYWYSNVGLPID